MTTAIERMDGITIPAAKELTSYRQVVDGGVLYYTTTRDDQGVRGGAITFAASAPATAAVDMALFAARNADGSTVVTTAPAVGGFTISNTAGSGMHLNGHPVQNAITTDTATWVFQMPADYGSGSDFNLNMNAGWSGGGQGTGTLTVGAYPIANDGTQGSSIVVNAVQALTAGAANKSYQVSGVSLLPGTRLLITAALRISEVSGAATVTGRINSVQALYSNGSSVPVNALELPSGITGQRPLYPRAGMIRFNSTTNLAEVFDGTNWATLFTEYSGGITSPLLVGTGSPGGLPYQLQSAIDFDPSAGPAVSRQNMFNTTLTYAVDTTHLWEGVTSFIAVNGPGHANGEINGMHAYLQVNAGATVASHEGFESSVLNNGAYSGVGFLALANNGTTAVSSGIAGIKFQLTNNNGTEGAIAEYSAIDNYPMAGAGSTPTAYHFIRNADPDGSINTLGKVMVGQLGPPPPDVQVRISGADNSAGSFPLSVVNMAGTNIFNVTNDGVTHMGGGSVVIGPAGHIGVGGADNSAGTYSLDVKSLSGTGIFSVSNDGVTHMGGGSVAAGPTGVSINGANNSAGTFPLDIKNLSGTGVFSVSNDGAAHFAAGNATVDPNGNIFAPNVIAPVVTLGNGGKPTITCGTGAPTAFEPAASIYTRIDGATNARLYVSAGGGTWVAIPSA